MKHWQEIYNKQYQDKYHVYADTPLGVALNKARWELVERHAKGDLRILDWGCAAGVFHKNSPNGFRCEGYDINPTSEFNKVPSIGPTPVDVLTFWDVLEHIPDFIGLITYYTPKFIFLSTPNLESVSGDIRAWKHYRPYEHVYYFDQHSLAFIFDAIGYDMVETNFEEGELRDPKCPDAIISAAFVKR